MEVEGNNTSLTNDQFLNAMLRVALERPDLIGIVDNRLLPPKEQGLSLAFREAPQRAVVDLDDVKYDNRINQFSIRGRYNNVAGFNFVLMRGVFAIFRQLDIPVRDIWDIAPKPHAIMGPEALEIEIASREGQKD
jgi:hypothetical protein